MAADDVILTIEAKYTVSDVKELAENYGVDPDTGVENLTGCYRGIEEAVYGWIQEQVQEGIEGNL